MILANVAYTKKNVDGTFTDPVELKFVDFTEAECLKHIGVEALGMMDSCAEHTLPHFKMISIEIAQEKPWTWERHTFIIAK